MDKGWFVGSFGDARYSMSCIRNSMKNSGKDVFVTVEDNIANRNLYEEKLINGE